MQVFCGTDIIEINRVKESIERLGDKFINEIYTSREIEYCESRKMAKYSHYAGRFAAKEAIYKAISSLLKDRFEMSWKDVQVINDDRGNPQVEFINNKIDIIKNIDISISHCKEYAVATVVAMVEE